ncbi:MAG: hypothetical protein GXN91_05425 [Epsilonproteobacteria bacterium]|nr:hypothetical protein [Campylobacterota bacterium]
MEWIFYTKIVAFIMTLAILYLLGKELIGSIKRSNNNEGPDNKWDID